MSVFICLNGKIMPADQPALMADNRGYRYGDGLFETIKVWKRAILLESFHFERLFAGLEQLKFQWPVLLTTDMLRQQILSLCEKNNCTGLARVRLSIFRGNGGINDVAGDLQYMIECWPANESVNQFNENGLIIDIYPEAKKSCDKFSNLKSANYLPYVMAAAYAKENKLNDCLVLNTYNRIAESSIANIFLVKDNEIITPSLGEGCVNGVMRRYLLEQYPVKEAMLTIDDLLSADELFLTNAMYGIRWVKQFRDKMYANMNALQLHRALQTKLWA